MRNSLARAVALAALASSALVPRAHSQVGAYEFSGEEADLHLGASVADVGDLDHDGFPEIAVGSQTAHSSHYGIVQVYSAHTGALLWTIQSGVMDDGFGSAVAGIGDVDADGVPDLAVGAPRPSSIGCGRVRVYSGRTRARLRTLLMPGYFADCYAGCSLAACGDIDLDQVPDILVGAVRHDPQYDSVYGSAAVFSGTDGALLYHFDEPEIATAFGWSVAGPGDLDGDGYPDLVIGAPYEWQYASKTPDFRKGAVYVYSGRDASLMRILRGPIVNGCFGFVAAAGDVDLDGRPDLLVGAPGSIFAATAIQGTVTLFSGRDFSVVRRYHGEHGEKFGMFLGGGRDVDRDGRPDFAVGAPNANAAGLHSGAAYVFSGRDGATLHVVAGSSDDARLGPVALLGDVNDDGASDLLVGAPGSNGPHLDAGHAALYLLGQPVPRGECFPTFNSFGCGSSLTFEGTPSVSVGESFVVTAPYFMNRQPGFVLWGFSAASVPLGGGTLCVRPRVIGPLQDTGGSPIPATDCSGSLRIRFTPDYLEAHGALPGKTVHCQFQSRDPHIVPPNDVMLSDALVFTVIP